MMEIALTYTNEHPLPTLTFASDIENILDTGSPDGGILDGGQNFYFPLYFYKILNKTTNTAITKRGRLVKHKINQRKQYNIIIGADTLSSYTTQNGVQNNFKLEHLISFFNADYHYLAVKNSTWSDYIPVVISEDSFSPEYLKNNLRFPQVSITLLEVEAYG